LVIGFILFVLLFIPAVREEIIYFGEALVVFRGLNRPVWHHILITIGIIFSAVFSTAIAIALLISRNIYKFTCEFYHTYLNDNLSGSIKKLWNDIPRYYKISFVVIFLGLNIVFMLHTTNFIFGNHEWVYLLDKMRLFSWHIVFDRYFNSVFVSFFIGGRFLLILTNLTNFSLFVLAFIYCRFAFGFSFTIF
jgi:hypothetical protein